MPEGSQVHGPANAACKGDATAATKPRRSRSWAKLRSGSALWRARSQRGLAGSAGSAYADE